MNNRVYRKYPKILEATKHSTELPSKEKSKGEFQHSSKGDLEKRRFLRYKGRMTPTADEVGIVVRKEGCLECRATRLMRDSRNGDEREEASVEMK